MDMSEEGMSMRASGHAGEAQRLAGGTKAKGNKQGQGALRNYKQNKSNQVCVVGEVSSSLLCAFAFCATSSRDAP